MHTSEKTGFWRLACSLALVASLSVSAGADTESGGDIPADSNSTEIIESPENGSRSAEGFPVPEGIEYPWLMPMFGAELCSKIDGYLCGIGVRVGTKAYFLASVRSGCKVIKTLRALNQAAGPGVFDLNAPDRIDISHPNYGGGPYWKPEFKQMVRHNIGLYVIYLQSKIGPFSFTPERGYPNKKSAPLQTKKGAIKDDCFLLSYGHHEDGGKAIDAPMRYKNYVSVKRIKCNDYLCDMETVRDIDEKGNAGGSLCGTYSELGAPIVCGYGPEETVDYIVSGADISIETNCTYTFKALEVSGYGQEIIDQVAKFEKEDQQTAEQEAANWRKPLGWGR
jgi:hypothetical protein